MRGAGQEPPPCQSSGFCKPGALPSPLAEVGGPLPETTVDSWAGGTPNRGVWAEGQTEAKIQLRLFSRSHAQYGLGVG